MTEIKKHIVLITTWFPPSQGVAVNRMVGFAKYLDKNKFDITVLTLLDQEVATEDVMYDCKIKRLPNKRFFKLPVFNSSDKKIRHYLKVGWKIILSKLQSDIYRSWRKEVVNELNRQHSKKKIDLIISSFSPEAAHLAALDFLEKNSSVKWIADMRDEMSQNPTIAAAEKRKYLEMESRINKRADAVTTVSEPLVNLFRDTTMTAVAHVEEIRNGFDHEIPNSEITFNALFTIVYCGSFYGAHKPDLFFEAMLELENENKLRKGWKIIFVGTSQSIQVPKSIQKNCSFVGRVSQAESIEYMRKADANLFMLPKSGRVGVYTGKLFDYLSVQKPVLAIVDPGDVAAKLINRMKAGFVASNENKNEVKAEIMKAYHFWEEKKELQVDHEEILKLHRRWQVEKLNLLIDKILDEK